MKCPSCNTPGCYVGLNIVECLNAKCLHATEASKAPRILEWSTIPPIVGLEAWLPPGYTGGFVYTSGGKP